MENKIKYLNEREVSQMTGIALSTLRNNRHLKRGINFSRAGRSIRYSLQDVVEYMESRKIEVRT